MVRPRRGREGDRYNRALPPGRKCAAAARPRPNDMTKYVFVTGGVVSSLGKGIASASLAAILESRGLKVTLIKLDPYLNVDPGTMSPFQHGEVFVTDDGAETDLDLGHYERFISTQDEAQQQLHHRPDLQERAREGAPRRLPRQDGAGDPARHQRDPGFHPSRRRRSATTDRGAERGAICRGRRHGRRHRVAAVPRSGAPVEPEARARRTPRSCTSPTCRGSPPPAS